MALTRRISISGNGQARAAALLALLASVLPLAAQTAEPPLPEKNDASLFDVSSSIEAPLRFKNAPAPAASAPAKRRRADAPAAVLSPSDKAGAAAWWRIFNDPALNRLEEQAAAENQDLARALARIDEARAQTRVAAADFLPRIGFSPSAQRLRTTNTGPKGKARIIGNAGSFGALLGDGTGGDDGGTIPPAATGGDAIPAFTSRALSTTYSDYRAPLTLNYELDVFGRIRRNYAGARANQAAIEADQRAIALSLSAEVATGYFAMRALDSEADVLRGNVKLRRDAVQINQERVNNGVANPLDLSRAQVELSTTEGDLQDILRQRDETENRLAELCGQSASKFRLPSRPLEALTLPAVPAGVPSDLLLRRPDLAEAERRLAAAAESIGAAQSQFLPTFSIQGSAGFESSLGDRLFDSENRALSILGSINIPIFEGGRNAAGLRAARARREQVLAAYRATALTAFKEVENALADLRRYAAQYEARQRGADAANDVLDRSQKRYIEGAVNYFEVVDAQRGLLGTQISLVQTRNARFAATIDLIRAIGGNWGHPPVSPSAK